MQFMQPRTVGCIGCSARETMDKFIAERRLRAALQGRFKLDQDLVETLHSLSRADFTSSLAVWPHRQVKVSWRALGGAYVEEEFILLSPKEILHEAENLLDDSVNVMFCHAVLEESLSTPGFSFNPFDRNLFWSLLICWNLLGSCGAEYWDISFQQAKLRAEEFDRMEKRALKACCYCATESPRFKCQKCKLARYCGSHCQGLDWKVHRERCKPVYELWESSETESFVLAPVISEVSVEGQPWKQYSDVSFEGEQACIDCERVLPRTEFSKNQLKRFEMEAACLECSERRRAPPETLLCCACKKDVARSDFSKSQRRRPQTLRKCNFCVYDALAEAEKDEKEDNFKWELLPEDEEPFDRPIHSADTFESF